ncbi:MAG TPA: hypothetical protein VIW29_05090, partial [Polyangiaceae bacterium]
MRTLIAGAGAIAFSMFAVACPEPADLENPPPNMTGGSSAGGMGTTTAGQSTTGGGGGVVCETPCIETLFTKGTKCTICHYKNDPPDAPSLGNLDLSTGYTARLKGIGAQHVDANFMPYPAGTCPTGDKLIDTANAAESWLWKKVNGGHGACGTAMPQPPTTLSAAEMMCVKAYVECVAGQPIGAGSTTGGTGGAAGGTGGAAGGTGGAAGGTG